MERDPVCEMAIRPGLEAASFNYQGKSYQFCSVECRDKFRANPSQYLKRSDSNVPAAETFVERAAPKEQT
jgi:P-type Cu+ transporter